MRTVLNLLGGLFVFFGVVWFLQGVNVLPGSFMTGQIQWAVYGAISAAVGVVLVVAARRLGANRPR